MKKQHFLLAAMTMMMATTTISGIAQESPAPPPPPARPDAPGHENIIIRKKSDKGEKMTIVVDGDKVTINGKPIAEYHGEDVIINQKHLDEMVGREMERVQFDKHMAEMNHQLADLDRQIELEVEPRVRNRIRFHSREPRILFSEDAPMALTFSGDNDFSGEKHAFLGVTTEKTDKGVRITNLTDESAAEKAGLSEGDVITTLDGKNVKDQEALTKMVREHKPGDEVSITYLHDGKSKKTKAKLGETSGGFKSFNVTAPSPDRGNFKFEMPEMPEMMESENFAFAPGRSPAPFMDFRGGEKTPRLGVQIEDLPEGKGVKVNEVRPESPAAKAGIQKDDVITHVDNKDVKDAGDMIDALKDAKDKSSFWISVQRKGAPVNMEVKIPKPIRKAEL